MHRRAHFDWKLRTRSLAVGTATRVMGILNVTPDSFSDGGLFHSVDEAVESALAMFADGAAIVDVGGESTRPGTSGAISTQQEIDRVLPVIEGIRDARPDALLSIDTYRAPTARAAISAGAEIVNDVSGLLWDDAMAAACANLQCGVILMHARGRPSDWKSLPRLAPGEVLPLVKRELAERLSTAITAGIAPEHIQRIYDPFFTIKTAPKEGQNRGTGLGLSVTYGIIQEHAGKIRVESNPGSGTTFALDFPTSRKAVHV